MTKSWEDIRERACQLYLSGKPLSEVRRQLERERQFKASVRAFRMKLKEWKAKRYDVAPCVECDNRVDASVEAFRGVEKRPTCDLVEVEPHHFRSVSREDFAPFESATNPAQLDYSEVPTISLARRSLRDLYRQLESVSELPSVEEKMAGLLENASFIDGSTCILHYASIKQNANVLHSIVEYMLVKDLEIDLKDACNMSALEGAIRTGEIKNVDILLQAGASVDRRTDNGDTPLHVACLARADWIICDLLLKYGASPHLRHHTPSGHCWRPLDIAAFPTKSQSSLDTNNQLLIVRAILQADTLYDPDSEEGSEAYENSLTKLKRFMHPPREPTDAFKRCLRVFLQKGSNPLCSYTGPFGCSCHTLAQSVFFHLANTSLPDLLIDHSNVEKYGEGLVNTVLMPCREASIRSTTATQNALLYKLLTRSAKFFYSYNPLCAALVRAPDDQKVAFVQTIVSTRTSTPAKLQPPMFGMDFDLGHPLEVLSQVDESLRWHLAEVILEGGLVINPHGLVMHAEAMQAYARIFVYDLRSEYKWYNSTPFRDKVASDISFDRCMPLFGPNKDVFQCVRCIMHVVTKHIINEEISAAMSTLPVYRDQVRYDWALEMRCEYKLPDLMVVRR